MWAMIIVVLAGAAAPQASATRLAEVRGLIAEKGAGQALQMLWKDNKRWDLLLDDIATGKPDWLGVAGELHAVSDAGASETLEEAIQEALPRNPEGVLRLVAEKHFSVLGACGMYGFGQCDEERPMPVIIGLVDKRIDAVSRVEKAGLKAVGEACLTELKKLRRDLLKQKTK